MEGVSRYCSTRHPVNAQDLHAESMHRQVNLCEHITLNLAKLHINVPFNFACGSPLPHTRLTEQFRDTVLHNVHQPFSTSVIIPLPSITSTFYFSKRVFYAKKQGKYKLMPGAIVSKWNSANFVF